MDYFFAYSIVLIVGMLVLLALMLYAQCAKLEQLESHFSENEHVRRHKRFWKRNQRIDRFHRMGLMIDMLSMPKAVLKEGLATEAELAAVPLALKRWALWPYRVSYIWIVLICIWYVWREWWPEWT